MDDRRHVGEDPPRQERESGRPDQELVLAPTNLSATSGVGDNPFASRASWLERLVGEVPRSNDPLRKFKVEWFGRPRREPLVHLTVDGGPRFQADLTAALEDHSPFRWRAVTAGKRRRVEHTFQTDHEARLHLGIPDEPGHRLEVYPLRGRTIERALRRVRTPTVVRVSVLVLPRRRQIPLRPANTSHAFGRLVPVGAGSRDGGERVQRADAAERWQFVVRIEVGSLGEVPGDVLGAIAADIRGAGDGSVNILLSGEAAPVDAEWQEVEPSPVGFGGDEGWPRDMAQLNLREAACLVPLPGSAEGAEAPSERLKTVSPRVPRRGIVVGSAGARRPVAITWEGLLRHVFIIGATGSGKSTCLLNAVDQIIRDPAKPAVIVLDPHGSLVERIAGCVRAEDVERVVWFDPSDPVAPMSWNPLAERAPIDPLIAACWEMWDPHRTMQAGMGPIVEQTLRAVFGTVVTRPGASLVDAQELIQNDHLARRYKVTDPALRAFWRMRADMSVKDKSELANYLTSKLSPFVHDTAMRAVVGQERSTLDLGGAIAEGRIVLGSLRKGELGSETATNLIRLLKRFLWREITARGAGGPDQRKVVIVIDEFTNYASELDEIMLAEARKFSTGIVLATQNLGRIRDSLTESIAANTANMLAYRTGLYDAAAVASMLGDPSIAQDLTTLPNYRAVARLPAAGEPLPPFIIDSPKPLRGFTMKRLEAVKDASRHRYGVWPPSEPTRPEEGST